MLLRILHLYFRYTRDFLEIADKKKIFNLTDATDIEAVTNLMVAESDDDIRMDDNDTDEKEHVFERDEDSESELSNGSNAEDEAESSNEAYIAHLKKNGKVFDSWI
ncbi:uncharacterized protein [Diabrotica undecimpunctata]|uniref:uncharacterized protein n=1 Tax=Diabrotica undecimpunctata TaxID=50387 RepID=UPI003B6347E3